MWKTTVSSALLILSSLSFAGERRESITVSPNTEVLAVDVTSGILKGCPDRSELKVKLAIASNRSQDITFVIESAPRPPIQCMMHAIYSRKGRALLELPKDRQSQTFTLVFADTYNVIVTETVLDKGSTHEFVSPSLFQEGL